MEKEDLTEEQKKKVAFLYKKYMMANFAYTVIHLCFLFAANVGLSMLNLLYVHNPEFLKVSSIGSAIVIFVGLRISIKELYDMYKEEVVKVLQTDLNR
jgi:hypothetical protein